MLENLNSMQLPPQVCAAETLTLYIIDFYGRLICKYDSFIVFYILLVFLINFFIIYTYIYTRPHKLLSFNSYRV